MADISNRFEEKDGETYIVEGRNAVFEALESGKSVEKLFVLEHGEETGGSLKELISRCRDNGAVIIKCDRKKLDKMSETKTHQGVVAAVSGCVYRELSDIIDAAEKSGRPPLVLVCDHIEDPHNLGAVIRSAEVAGAHGVIIPNRRSSGMTPAAIKASAGAAFRIPIVRRANIVSALEELKKAGLWIFGTDAGGDISLYDADFKGSAAIVMGSEGSGLSRLVRENCDFIVSIPMLGKLNSLNVSAAAAVVLFEAVRQRFYRGERTPGS